MNSEQICMIDFLNAVSTMPQYPMDKEVPAAQCKPVAKMATKARKKNMWYDNEDDCGEYNEKRAQRDYLQSRAYDISSNHEQKAREHFGLSDDNPPANLKEYLDRITAGKYILSTKDPEKVRYSYEHHIRWRDPSKKEDKEGYDAASKAINSTSQDVRDTIMVSEPADALKALKEFEAKTFH